MASRKESNQILKPFKVNNPRELRPNCEICQVRFQILLNTEHQCKRCYRVICEKCSQQKIKIYQPEGHTSVHKCCSICMKEEEAISHFVKQNKLFFGLNSTFSNEWIKRLKKESISSTAHEEKASIVTEFNQKIYETNSNIIRFKSESSRILNELCAAQNYSMRQFTGRLIEQISTDQLNEKIMQVMIGIYAYLKDVPYTSELVYLVFFLLCFCNEYDCYFIITRYIEKIFPQYFKMGNSKKDNLLTHELRVIIDMYKVLLKKKSDKEELQRVAKFLEKDFFANSIKSLLINVTNITISFYLIDEILRNSTYIPLYKTIAALIFHSRQLLYQEKETNEPIIQPYILKSITVQQIKNAMVIFQKSNQKFEMDHQFFDSVQHRKLYQKYKQLQSAYQRSQEKYRGIEFKHNALMKDYDQMTLKISELKKQNISMTEEIIKNAEKFIMIDDIDKYSKENEMLKKRNAHFTEENSLLKKQIEDFKKQDMIANTQKIIFERIKKDYERQIVDLKTKNEIYEIEKQANNIDFNTSFIQQKIQEKNRAIAELQGENNKLKIELDFYRNSRSNSLPVKEETLFHANISNIQSKNSLTYNNFNNTQNNSLNLSLLQTTTKEDKDKFKRFIEMEKKVTDKLKNDLLVSETRRKQLQVEVVKQKQVIVKLQKNLQLNQQINVFINQIPEDVNYTSSIQDLQSIISKQTNIHKKGKLQVVLRNFIKCLYEVRYRSIDAKLKENKIKQINQGICDIKQKAKQYPGQSSGHQMDESLNWIGEEDELAKVNRDSIKKEQCQIM